MDTSVKEKFKSKKNSGTKYPGNISHQKRPNLGIAGIDKGEEIEVKENIFNKITKENFPNLKKVMPIKVQEAYKIPKRMDQKKRPLST